MSTAPTGRPGLQPERTLLAWRRTALSLAAASVVAVRLTLGSYGPAAVVLGVGGLLLAAGAFLAADRRYRAGGPGGLADRPAAGAPAALLTVTTVLVGLLAALYVSQG